MFPTPEQRSGRSGCCASGARIRRGESAQSDFVSHAKQAVSPVPKSPNVRHWTFIGRVPNFRVPLVYQMQNKPLAERSVLLVEDDIILSTDLAFLLTEAGCKAVVPTTSNAAALSAMVHYIVD